MKMTKQAIFDGIAKVREELKTTKNHFSSYDVVANIRIDDFSKYEALINDICNNDTSANFTAETIYVKDENGREDTRCFVRAQIKVGDMCKGTFIHLIIQTIPDESKDKFTDREIMILNYGQPDNTLNLTLKTSYAFKLSEDE